MKYSRVINRPMFNKHNSAYGRGIASNLVTEEQRQRFNSGGRVKLQFGSSGWHVPTATTATGLYAGTKLPAIIDKTKSLYKPGWWERIKGLGSRGVGHGSRLLSALKPMGGITGAGVATSLPLVAAAASPFITQAAATEQREKGEYLPGGELIEESETEEFQPGLPIEIDGKKYKSDKWGGVDEFSFSEQELAGSEIPGYKDIKAEKDEKGNIKWHRDEDGRVIKHTAAYMRKQAIEKEKQKIQKKQIKSRIALGKDVDAETAAGLGIDILTGEDIKEQEGKKRLAKSDELDTEESLWSPQEKKEKMGQMQLAMAERLIGGSRDKWGSTAQMKNLAGAIGDVRKITDTAEERATQRKYEARFKSERKAAVELDKARRGYEYLIGNEGATPTEALRRSIPGLTAKNITKENRKDMGKLIKLGDVFYDEEAATWNLATPGGAKVVTIDEIKEKFDSGELDRMKQVTATVTT